MPKETNAEIKPEVTEKNPLEETLTVPVQYIFDMKTEVEKSRYERSTGRPIRLPQHLSAEEFNAIVDYMKDQRAKLLNIKGPSALKKIEIKDETKIPTKEKP